VPGVSERIRVTSVVDRFLEHTRVMAFGVAEKTEVYLSSADWMSRNFQRRIEVMFPIEDPALKTRLLDEILGTFMKDNVKARRLASDGTYLPVDSNGPPLRVQSALLEVAKRNERTPQIIRHAAAPEVAPESIRPAAAG
jgi:polyphosphate kinase